MSKNPRVMAGKFLSQALRDLSQEAHDTDGDRTKTRADCLAEFIWNAALGYKAKVWNEKKGGLIEKEFGPQTWAIALIFDRLEGKVPMAEDDASPGATLAQRVAEISKDNINKLAE